MEPPPFDNIAATLFLMHGGWKHHVIKSKMAYKFKKISIRKEKPCAELIVEVYHFSKKITQIMINQVNFRL
jgi:hypothetical protein